MRISIPERGSPGRRAGRGLPVAAAVLLASVAPAARGDACADFRAAIAIETAAREAWISHITEHSVSVFDSEREARAKSETQKSLNHAHNLAIDARKNAERKVRESIEDESTSAIIDAVVALRRASVDALRAASTVRQKHPPEGSVGDVIWRLVSVNDSAREAHHEALMISCRLGLARTE